MLTANVFVNIPVKSIARAYTYSVPAELSYLEAGLRRAQGGRLYRIGGGKNCYRARGYGRQAQTH